jgi:hypothetical protein
VTAVVDQLLHAPGWLVLLVAGLAVFSGTAATIRSFSGSSPMMTPGWWTR